MTLKERLNDELKDGMRAGDTTKVSVIRLLRSVIKNKEIEIAKGHSLTDEEIFQVISSGVKQRKESIELFEKGGRRDLVEKEQKELAILRSFLPQPISDEELRLKVTEAIAQVGTSNLKDMGKVMKLLTQQLAGKVEGSRLSQVVRECLDGRKV
ncbi:MAG: GatB/YqeY domain-containing protein [Candidatus Manganitrophaceae bacterium]